MWSRLQCVTPAAAVVSLEAAKEHLRVDHSDHNDMIEGLVLAAQAAIEGPLGIGVAIAASSWRLSLDAFAPEIRIPLRGVKAISAITYVDADGGVQTLASSEYLLDPDGYPARLVPAWAKAWPSTRAQPGAVKILFTAGEAAAPRDLVQAVLLLVGHYYANPEAVAVNTLAELPLGIRAILGRHAATAV